MQNENESIRFQAFFWLTAFLIVIYLSDLFLTYFASITQSGFQELNPFVSFHVNQGYWLLPAVMKAVGVFMLLVGYQFAVQNPRFLKPMSILYSTAFLVFTIINSFSIRQLLG